MKLRHISCTPSTTIFCYFITGHISITIIVDFFHRISSSVNESSEFSSVDSSFDLNESFKELLNRKREELEQQKNIPFANTKDDCRTVNNMNTSSIYECGNDSTFIEQSDDLASDASFLEAERLSNITQSNTTLIDLTESRDDNLVDVIKEQHQDGLKQLMIKMQINNETMLNDIEAPSCLFENSVFLNSPTHQSPIKMIGMLRPSTILEETHTSEYTSASFENNSGSLDSYITAETGKTNNNSGTESEYYKTADEQNNSISLMNKIVDDSQWSKISVQSSKISMSEDSLAMRSADTVSGNDSTASLNSSGVESISIEEILDEAPAQFNDTIEEMDFLMQQGMKFLTPNAKSGENNTFKYTPTPKAKNISPFSSATKSNYTHILKGSPVTPNFIKLGAIPKASTKPELPDNDFKRPLFPTSRIPKSNIPIKNKFDYIVSPIRTYIKETPEVPLYSKNRGTNVDCNLSKLYPPRQSILNTKENEPCDLDNYVSTLPRKAFIQAPNRVVNIFVLST